ncbi:type VI secretion system-associated FHA domain protein TagH [Sphingomonas radiodurans]|uniref:type VI secretion system-associated FHA domain protein TagH n=1 Tax=Sphingomonas radiodurans TaxID=2890321 RepID=UPI001E5D159C|nr:type VI secretion system-associated FHA domain protein TagH [Sphingomonas radiodurans]WBH16692.1 type VI secretion system-associated FHA domain protein TagH [Sphingomonas radiodurans]
MLSRTGDPPGTFFDRRHLDSGEIKVGRSAVMCDIVLPDDEGVVSRTHCTILAAGLELFVLDQSSNGVALNDPVSRIAPHTPVPVRSNDRLIIGSFVITIATEAMGAGIALVPPPPPPLPGMAAQPRGQDAWFDAPVDAMWDDGPQGAAMHDFLGGAIHDMLAPAGGAIGPPRTGDFGVGDLLGQAFSRPILADPLPPPVDFGIPEDWAGGGGIGPDPFAAQPSPVRDPFGDMPPPRAELDDPFGDMPQRRAPLVDPFADMSPSSVPFDDPFGNLPAPPKQLEDPFGDTPSAPSGGRLADPFDFAPAASTAAPSGSFDTFDAPPPPPPPPAPPAAAPAAQINGDAWAAFYEGAGLTAEELRLAPDAMRRLGIMYRQVVLGLSDILQDRAAFKDEFRVERTQISIGRNNPLKHLPPLDAAKVLMGDPLPGFMNSEDAIRTAFEDAKKHQLAMLAGVQRALTAVFDRLSPPEIEKMIEKATSQKKGLSFRRGVDRWSVYLTVFEALRRDATSNANGVMSVAFREGYEDFLKSAR